MGLLLAAYVWVMYSSSFSYSVFWLEHLIHLHLRLLLVGSYSLPIFYTYDPLFLPLFLPFLKAVRLASLAELVWWRCILLDFFCLGNSLFDLLSWLRALLGKVVLVAGLWFSLLGIFFWHSLLAWSVSIEKSVANLIRASLYITSCFSLAFFKIHSLSWIIMYYLI